MKLTIRQLMILVVIAAMVAALALQVPRAIDPFLRDRDKRPGKAAYIAIVASAICILVAPFLAGARLLYTARRRQRPTQRRLAGCAMLGAGTAMLVMPMDGLREAHRAGGSFVAYYHQYRFLPGRHVTPCLELYTLDGRSRSYPVGVHVRIPFVRFRTNPGRTMVWLVEADNPPSRSRGVLCSLDLATGDFVGMAGPFPEGVSEGGGLPL